jgi:hypothetical protein
MFVFITNPEVDLNWHDQYWHYQLAAAEFP